MTRKQLRQIITEVAKERITEVKFDKESIIAGGKVSCEVHMDPYTYTNSAEIRIYFNGGNSYDFITDPETINRLSSKRNLENVKKDIEKIALKIGLLIEKELQKIEQKYK